MTTRIELSPRGAVTIAADVHVLFASQDGAAPKLADAGATKALARELKRRDYRASPGRTLHVVIGDGKARRNVVVAGIGRLASLDAERVLAAVAAAGRAAGELRAASVASELPPGPEGATREARVRLAALAFALASYRFDRYLSDPPTSPAPGKIVLGGVSATAGTRRALAEAAAVARGNAAARDLVNEPAGTLTPARFVTEIRRMARGTGLTVRVLGPGEIEKQKMGALSAVARGSAQPPRVVHMAYKPKGRAKERLAFIGKGVTFDSGGYNLKGGAHILDMKCDMAGAAAVVGAMLAIVALKPRTEVHGVVGLVENLVSGDAYKPGDVLKTRSGRTVEINNTDAEGRLVLADLLDWTSKTIKPAGMVDLATLTGACVVALGPAGAGLMTNDTTFGERVGDAARDLGERMWPLPLWDDYMEQLESDIADCKNTGGRYGGTLTAGLFLRQFVPDGSPWVHLDIAGPAFYDKPHPFWGKGGSGFGVATLVRLAGALGD